MWHSKRVLEKYSQFGLPVLVHLAVRGELEISTNCGLPLTSAEYYRFHTSRDLSTKTSRLSETAAFLQVSNRFGSEGKR